MGGKGGGKQTKFPGHAKKEVGPSDAGLTIDLRNGGAGEGNESENWGGGIWGREVEPR